MFDRLRREIGTIETNINPGLALPAVTKVSQAISVKSNLVEAEHHEVEGLRNESGKLAKDDESPWRISKFPVTNFPHNSTYLRPC